MDVEKVNYFVLIYELVVEIGINEKDDVYSVIMYGADFIVSYYLY